MIVIVNAVVGGGRVMGGEVNDLLLICATSLLGESIPLLYC